MRCYLMWFSTHVHPLPAVHQIAVHQIAVHLLAVYLLAAHLGSCTLGSVRGLELFRKGCGERWATHSKPSFYIL
jgi:hypothetical protein